MVLRLPGSDGTAEGCGGGRLLHPHSQESERSAKREWDRATPAASPCSNQAQLLTALRADYTADAHHDPISLRKPYSENPRLSGTVTTRY